jgi:hypothetical protein
MASELHARSKKALEEHGWEPGTVERRMAAFKGKKEDGTPDVTPFGRTVDLWGWCDLVAFHPDAVRLAFVQVCSASGITSHKQKIEAWGNMRRFLEHPLALVHLHVWRKPKKGVRTRWSLEIHRLQLSPAKEYEWRPTSL